MLSASLICRIIFYDRVMARYEFLALLLFFNSGRGGGGVMEMLNRMGLARLVNPCFKITVLEISGRPVV